MELLFEKNSNLAYLLEFTLARIEKLRSNATRKGKYESFVEKLTRGHSGILNGGFNNYALHNAMQVPFVDFKFQSSLSDISVNRIYNRQK